MTERFTEKMIDRQIGIANKTLKEMRMPFVIAIERQTLEHRIHRFYMTGGRGKAFQGLTHPYGQKTGEAYLTARAMTELLCEIQRQDDDDTRRSWD